MQADSGSACHILSGPSDYLLYFGMMSDVLCTTVGASGAWNALAGSSPTVVIRGQWVIATMQYNGATRTTTGFLNGVAMAAKGPDGLQQNSGAAWNHLYIGNGPSSSGTGGSKLQGYIAEILIYDSVLSVANRGGVETWLSNKYGFGVAP